MKLVLKYGVKIPTTRLTGADFDFFASNFKIFFELYVISEFFHIWLRVIIFGPQHDGEVIWLCTASEILLGVPLKGHVAVRTAVIRLQKADKLCT